MLHQQNTNIEDVGSSSDGLVSMSAVVDLGPPRSAGWLPRDWLRRAARKAARNGLVARQDFGLAVRIDRYFAIAAWRRVYVVGPTGCVSPCRRVICIFGSITPSRCSTSGEMLHLHVSLGMMVWIEAIG